MPHPAQSQRGWIHLFDYIEVYYNRQRLHSMIGYLSPEAFEATQVA